MEKFAKYRGKLPKKNWEKLPKNRGNYPKNRRKFTIGSELGGGTPPQTPPYLRPWLYRPTRATYAIKHLKQPLLIAGTSIRICAPRPLEWLQIDLLMVALKASHQITSTKSSNKPACNVTSNNSGFRHVHTLWNLNQNLHIQNQIKSPHIR